MPFPLRARRHLLTRAIALSLLPLPALASPALPADDARNFDAIVVTASGFEQKLTDAPASISVITPEQLRARPYITLIDAVRDLEGVDVGETSDKTGQRTISIRGMGADYTLVLIDGKRQNNHGDIYPNSFGGNQFNHLPPLDMIERIEVIRGPASTLYGADALGGVINIITRRVASQWNGSATLGHSIQEDDRFGSDTTFDFALNGPLLGERLGLGLRGSRYQRDASTPEYETILDPAGQPHERALGFGGGGKTVDNTNTSAGLTLGWMISERQDLDVDVDVSRQKYDNSPYINNLGTLAYPLGTVDGITSIWRAAPQVGYVAEQRFNRDTWSITHRGSWDWGDSVVSLASIETSNDGRTLPFTVAERVLHQQMYCNNAATCTTGAYAGMTRAQRQALMESTFLPRPKRNMESSQYTLDAKFDVPFTGWGGKHHAVFGGQVIDGELDDGVFGMETGGDGAGIVQDHEMWSLFVEDNISPNDALTLTFGLRHDEHNVFGGHLSPRAYAVYELGGNWTLKGGISTGYKTPKTTDLYEGITGFGGQGTSPWTGNPDLKPETSVNSEVAVYWTAADGRHSFNATWFQNDFEDKIANTTVTRRCSETGGVRPCADLGAFWDVLGIGSLSQPINVDRVEVQGLELAGRIGLREDLSLRANYTYTDSEQLTGAQAGLPLTQTARHMFNATLDWQLAERWNLQLLGETRSDRFRGVDAAGNPLYWSNYSVLHLAAQWRVSERVSLSARINNLTDKDFTSFTTTFVDLNGDGAYDGTGEVSHQDHFNNKDKARNLWLSLNVRF